MNIFKKIKENVGIILGSSIITLGLFLGFSGVASATVAFPSQGGTGTSSTPQLGQILTGTSGGIYTPTTTINASSVQASIIDRGGQIFNVKSSQFSGGAKCDGATDDSAAYQAAETAAGAVGGTVLSMPGICLINTPVNVSSNTITTAVSRGATIFKSTTLNHGLGHNAIFQTTLTNNVIFQNLAFNLVASSGAITSYGSNNLKILNSDFTGTGAFDAAIVLEGNAGSGSFTNTTIDGDYFHDMASTTRIIYLYSRNGNTVSDTNITNDTFASTTGAAVWLDDFSPIYRTTLTGDHFLNLYGGYPHNSNNTGVALIGGVGTPGIEQTIFSNNQYKNTITTSTDLGANEGVVYLYAASGTVISNNSLIGSWTPSTHTVGPAIALGNLSTPDYHTVISNNNIQGFDSGWDPDSQVDSQVNNNVVSYSGACFNLGYGTQINIDIHDNICYDTGLDTNPPYVGWVTFANSSPVNSNFSNNIYLQDTTSTSPTTTIVLTGGFNFSDVTVKNNIFKTASSTLSTSTLFTKQGGSEVLPLNVAGNEVISTNGRTVDVGGIYSQLATSNIFSGINTFSTAAFFGSTVNVSSTLTVNAAQGGSGISITNSGSQIFGINYSSGGLAELQSFSGHSLMINDQGNNIILGGNSQLGSALISLSGSVQVGGAFIASSTATFLSTTTISSSVLLDGSGNKYVTSTNAGTLTGNGTSTWIPFYQTATGFTSNASFTYSTSTFVFAAPIGTFSSGGSFGTSTTSTATLVISAPASTDAIRVTATQGQDFFNAYVGANQLFDIVQKSGNNNVELQSFGGHQLLLNDQGNNVVIGTTSGSSLVTDNGNESIGSGFAATAAPTNGLSVQGAASFGTTSTLASVTIAPSNTATTTLSITGLPQFLGSSTVITPSIGGAIGINGCDSATSSVDISVTSSTTSFPTTPVNDPGATALSIITFLSAPGVITTRVCSAVAVTPNATTYVVKIIK